MGGAVSAGQDHDDLIDKLKTASYVKTSCVENVYRAVDRAFYFLPECKESAYKDLAWKKGNIHLSAPCIYAEVLESLSLEPGLSFLNVGSGTGYLNTMVGLVLGPYGINHGIELCDDVVEYARNRLDAFKRSAPALDCYEFCEPEFVTGNGLHLGSEVRLYDRVYCGAACPGSHDNYMKNLLKVGGVLVVPLNDKLMRITRLSETEWESRSVLSVSFSSLQMPITNKPTIDQLVCLPEVHPLTLQEICRSVVRTLLRKSAEEEFPNIAIRRRKYYSRNKRRRTLPELILPILGSSDDELDVGRNMYVPAGLRNIGCVIELAPTIGRRGYRAVHALAPRLREGDDGFAIGEAEEIEDPTADVNPGNGESSSGDAPSNARQRSIDLPAFSTGGEVNADADMEDAADSQEDDSDDDEPNNDLSKRRRRRAKREKIDSGVDPDFDLDSTPARFLVSDNSSNDSSSTRRLPRPAKRDSGVGPETGDSSPSVHPSGSYVGSDDSSDSDGKMDAESDDSETSSPLRKSPLRDDSAAVPLYSEVMREKIDALSLPPTLKAYLNYDRPAPQL